MESLFTRNELIFFKIVGWMIAIIVPTVLYRWNSRELKESEKEQKKRTDDLWQKLQKETKERVELEKKIIKENEKRLNLLYQQEKEMKEKHRQLVSECEKEIIDLRNQLLAKGLRGDKHDISDRRRRKDAVWKVKKYWEKKQNKSGKINGRTITDVLGGEKWKDVLEDKEGEEILRTRDWLIKKIDDELELAK